MFRSCFDNMLNRRHPLYRLSHEIDVGFFEKKFGPLHDEKVGLHILKHAFGESDESMVERFVENRYLQCYCGFEFFQHTFPLDPTSQVRWRKRIEPEGMEKLLQETITTAAQRQFLRRLAAIVYPVVARRRKAVQRLRKQWRRVRPRAGATREASWAS